MSKNRLFLTGQMLLLGPALLAQAPVQTPAPAPAQTPAPAPAQAPAQTPAPTAAAQAPTAPAADAHPSAPSPAAPAPAASVAARASAPAPAPAAPSQTLLRGYILPEVTKPKDMFYRGPGAGVGSLFGAIGAAATVNADHSAKGELMALMDKEHIDIAQILLEQTEAKLAASTGVEKRIQALKGPRLQTEILMYGLVKTQLFSSTMYPTIKVKMTLTQEGDPKPVWQETEWVATAAIENNKGFAYDEFMKDPEKIRVVWKNVSKIAADRLINALLIKFVYPDSRK